MSKNTHTQIYRKSSVQNCSIKIMPFIQHHGKINFKLNALFITDNFSGGASVCPYLLFNNMLSPDHATINLTQAKDHKNDRWWSHNGFRDWFASSRTQWGCDWCANSSWWMNVIPRTTWCVWKIWHQFYLPAWLINTPNNFWINLTSKKSKARIHTSIWLCLFGQGFVWKILTTNKFNSRQRKNNLQDSIKILTMQAT